MVRGWDFLPRSLPLPTPDELERRRKRQLALGQPPVYDRASLKLTKAERAALEGERRKPYWRFKLTGETAIWDDLVRGAQSIETSSLSDPVVQRDDGTFLYTFTSVIDDANDGITHIIRGEDHVTNTGVQIEIFRALGSEPPVFAHHNLLVAADGSALSKRLGSLSIASFREEGLEPMAVASHSALIGTSHPVEPHQTLAELAALFDFTKISRAPARFDPDELRALNAKLLHTMPYSAAAPRLAAMGVEGSEAFWTAVRPNLGVFSDVKLWARVVSGDITPVIENAGFCERAAALLPPEPWTDQTWTEWTIAVKAETGAKGRELFHPLRLALTGEDRGPEMKLLLPLIGAERARARLTYRSE